MMACAPVRAEVVDRIIAVVNDDIITLHEFNVAFAPYLKNIETTYQGKDKDAVIRQTRESFLQRLVEHLLIEQEAKKTGISATVREEDVMGILQDTLAKQNLSMQDFLKNLEAEGSSIEQVKKDIRSQMIRMRLLRREVKDRIIVTDEEIGEYYNQHRDEYEGRESVRIKQLLLPLAAGADKNTKMKIRNEASRLRELIKQGEPFDMLVAKYSQSPAAIQGGDLGFIEKGTIIPEVEAAAFSLDVGQVSDVIESKLGFHIIKAVDKKGAGIKPIAVVREEIKAKIEEEKLEKKYEEWIASLMARSHVEVRP
jgi:parvulin-like peptidyl-prolyl isomerase